MKQIKLNSLKALAMAICTGGFMLSCSESIDVAGVDEQQYELNTQPLAFITDKYGASHADSLFFSDQGATDFYVNLTHAATASQTLSVAYDVTALNNYNLANGTKYEALPENLVAISGEATVAAGASKSAPVKVSYQSAEQLKLNGTYAIPLVVKGGNGVQPSAEKGEFVLLLKDITKMPDCHKENGLQVINCMEINDGNPLYSLSFTLEKSGKFFFDQVILFSGNINYNAETGEVYNYNNDNISHVLNYKEKYLEPLQRKGMKVILGILGNHDRSAITNLSDEGCRLFAKELKAKLDAYNLDGIFLDDEYSKPGNYPGFVTYNNASRLCYELKKAMPDKLVQVYVYGGTSSISAVEGKQPGEFVDYGIHDYGRNFDLGSNYPGMDKKGMIMSSIECARGYASPESDYRSIRENGYGGTMVFGLTPARTNLNVLNSVARAFYDDTIKLGEKIEKDW